MAPVDSMSMEELPLLRFTPGSSRAEVLKALEAKEANFLGLDVSMLDFPVDEDFIDQLLESCDATEGGAILRLAHNELSSGTDCEQRIFDLRAERLLREADKERSVKRKADSAKQKDFAASAEMRRQGQAGIEAAEARLAAIDKELSDLNTKKETTPWSLLFSAMKVRTDNHVRRLDLTNCGLHATSLVDLTQALLHLECYGSRRGVTELILDGNDLGDSGTVSIALLLRMSACLEVISLRNIGVTDGGFSQILSSLVSNKCIALVDLRNNGLCTAEVSAAAVSGVRRFNRTAQILI